MTPIDHPSPNHGPRPADTPVDMLVLHYTGMVDTAAALDRLCDPVAQVSAHYLINTDGTLYRLVAEDRRAWHAGISYWRGHTDINSRSIGIELANPGHEWGYVPFTEPQMQTLIPLALGILARHPIPSRNVIGHSDVAPARKQDPGEQFDWPRLAAQGIGLWPGQFSATPDASTAEMLDRIGYDPNCDLALALTAFQRHWLPDHLSGQDDVITRQRLAAVAAMLGPE